MTSSSKGNAALGFLTVLEKTELGVVGGYLLLNGGGRPLEFHCTSPVRPNRAQEILYGPTLRPFLYGEQIAQALAAKARTPIELIVTDQAAVLAVRSGVDVPVALLVDDETAAVEEPASRWRVDTPHARPAGLERFALLSAGTRRLAVEAGRDDDHAAAARVCQRLPADFDLAEPFGRIREALQETLANLSAR